MCSLSRSPAPVVGVRRLAKITQRFRNLLCGVCHGDIVPFLGPVPEGKFLVTDGQPGVGGALWPRRRSERQGGASPSGVSRPLRRAGGISRGTTERPGKRPNSPVPASLRPPTVPPRDTRGRVVEVKPCLTGSFFAELLDETGPVIGNHKATVRLPGRRSVPTAGTRAARSRGHVVEGCRRIEPARFG